MKLNRKKIYNKLIIIALLWITIGYAALNSTLNITGKSSISKNTWDVHFDNIQTKGGSTGEIKTPTIEDSTTLDFEVALNLPGDYYEFTVDVMNNGTIDAMIDSVTKTPDLTPTQQKYLNYTISYENGEQITTKQLIKSSEFLRLKVRIEYKSDITSSDLPTTTETLNLGFTVNYTQSDGTGINVANNGKNLFNVTTGDLNTIGSEISIGNEQFYLISSDDNQVALLAKYNLYVGYTCSSSSNSSCTAYGDEATGIQDSTMIGVGTMYPSSGTTYFSGSNYWYYYGSLDEYAYVYDSKSHLYSYVENYKSYLENLGANIEEARLISRQELENLQCRQYDCGNAPSWIRSSSYWTGTSVGQGSAVWVIRMQSLTMMTCDVDFDMGVRPVIVVSKSNF